jgi:hypothetical protein
MAAPSRTQVFRTEGRLIVGPTGTTPPSDLDAADPYGGTHLGITYQLTLRVTPTYERDHAEEFRETVEIYEAGQEVALVGQCREWNDTVISTMHPATATGASSAKKNIRYPGTYRAGSRASDRAIKLLWVPRRHTEYPAILIPKALPLLARPWEVDTGITREIVTEVLFEAIRDSSGRLYTIEYIEDMSL